MRYIYIDETFFGQNDQFIGCGAITSHTEITENVILDALNALKNDPDFNLNTAIPNQDSSTLNRNYFHACEDSKNAHSHLAQSINKNIQGKFSAWLGIKPQEQSDNNTLEEYAAYAVLGSLNCYEPIKIIFENRNGLNEEKIQSWLNRIEEEIFLLENNFRDVCPSYYPSIKIEIAGKDNPGLQCIDLMLWASTREFESKSGNEYFKFFEKNNPKFGTNNFFSMKASPTTISNKDEIEKAIKDNVIKNHLKEDYKCYDLYLNQGLPEKDFFYDDKIKRIEDISRPTTYTPIDLKPIEHMFNALINIQKVVNNAYKNPDKQISHLSNIIQEAYDNRFQKGPKHIINLAKTFVKLFDMLPVIDKNSSLDDKIYWLQCRVLMRNILNQRLLDNVLLRMQLNDVRAQIIEKHPDLIL